jgi:hypothetical protein
LVEGWHGHEADGRWTDGAALVPVELTEGQAVTVQLAASLAYPVTPMRQAVRG